MSTANIDLNKFLSEPSDILHRLYKETEIAVLTQEDFEKLPLNELYLANKRKQEDEQKKVEELPQKNNLINNNDK